MLICSSTSKSVGFKRNKKNRGVCLYYMLFRMGCTVIKWNDPLFETAHRQVTKLIESKPNQHGS